MSRPKPTVLLEHTDRKYNKQEIIPVEDIFSVFYEDKPITIRTMNIASPVQNLKYKKTSFGSKGHAFNLAKSLNELFKTDKFKVFKLVKGDEVIDE